MNKARLVVLLCTVTISLIGCADISVVGTESTENTGESTSMTEIETSMFNDDESTDMLNKILTKMYSLGIFGNITEGKASDEDNPPVSVTNHGGDYYVMVNADDGETYYGCIVDGEVKIWDSSETYDSSVTESLQGYDGNVVISLNVPDGFTNDVDMEIWCYGDTYDASQAEKVTVSLTKDNDYTAGLNLREGKCNIFTYTMSDNGKEHYYIDTYEFAASDEQSYTIYNVNEIVTE